MQRKEPHLSLNKTADGRTQLDCSCAFGILGADIGEDDSEMEKPGGLHVKVTPPRRKIAACKYFLKHLKRVLQNEASTLMFLEVLSSELRAITFALQKMFADVEDFRTWYDVKQEEMRKDANLRWIVELRNASQKQGLFLATWGARVIVRRHRDGGWTAEYASPDLCIEGFGSNDVIAGLEDALAKLTLIVEEAHTMFVGSINPRQFRLDVEFLRELPTGDWEHFDPGK